MTEQTYSDQALDEQRKFFRDAAGNPKQAFVPIKDRAGQVADMLDDLAERKRDSHCRACGEPAGGRYCPDHS